MSVPAHNRNYSTESVLIAVFSMAALLVHLLTNGRYGYFRDELYYIACGRHLDFGYVDQPVVDFACSIEPTGPGRFAFCDSPPTGVGGCGDSCAHRDNRARDRRTRMGHRSRLRGDAICAVLSGSWKFLFHERVRAAVLDGSRLCACPNYQWRLINPLALAGAVVGTWLGKQTFHGVFRSRYSCWAGAHV